MAMRGAFKTGDHVSWNSEAGRVSGIIRRKISAPIEFKGYTVHASREKPQYLIESDKTDHLAIHKGSALRKLRSPAGARAMSRRRRSRRGKAPDPPMHLRAKAFGFFHWVDVDQHVRSEPYHETIHLLQLKRVYENIPERTACEMWSIGCGRAA
jgi:hypothetical protein